MIPIRCARIQALPSGADVRHSASICSVPRRMRVIEPTPVFGAGSPDANAAAVTAPMQPTTHVSTKAASKQLANRPRKLVTIRPLRVTP